MSTSTAIDTGKPWHHHGTRQIRRVRFSRRPSIRTGMVHKQKGMDQRRTDMQAPLVGQVLWQGDGWTVTSVGLSSAGFAIDKASLADVGDTGTLVWPRVAMAFVSDWDATWPAFWEAFQMALKLHHRMPRDRFDQALLARSEAAVMAPKSPAESV
jgi:hypothetical protein